MGLAVVRQRESEKVVDPEQLTADRTSFTATPTTIQGHLTTHLITSLIDKPSSIPKRSYQIKRKITSLYNDTNLLYFYLFAER